MSQPIVNAGEARPLSRASFASYSPRAAYDGGLQPAVIVDMAALRASDPGAAARLEFATAREPFAVDLGGDKVAFVRPEGVAAAQWANKALREALRTHLARQGRRMPEAEYRDSLRDTLRAHAPGFLKRMPSADRQGNVRRARRTAVAEAQMSLMDALSTPEPQPSLFDAIDEQPAPAPDAFEKAAAEEGRGEAPHPAPETLDEGAGLTYSYDRENIPVNSLEEAEKEVEDGKVRDDSPVLGSEADQIRAAHGDEPRVREEHGEDGVRGVPQDAGTQVSGPVLRAGGDVREEGLREEPGDRGDGSGLRGDRGGDEAGRGDSPAGAPRGVGDSPTGTELVDSQAASDPLSRARANVKAIEVVTRLMDEDGTPTDDDIRALGAYSGWGGAADAFKEAYGPNETEWAEVNSSLRALLTEEEYADARSSTLTAFYTPSSVAGAMHDALAALGFGAAKKGSAKADRVLEPGCGTGNFMAVGDALGAGYLYDGIEIDPLSADIARFLHPSDNIVKAPLDACYISKDSYDAAIGNVPYSDAIKVPFGKRSVSVHDAFIMQSIECLRPGGVAALLTSRYTMDKKDATTRRWIAQRADLVGFVRLPEETFRAQAGTKAVSDVLLFRKRAEFVEEPDFPWIGTDALQAPDGSRVAANAALLADTESHAVGEIGTATGPYGYTLAATSGMDDKAIGEKLGELLSAQVAELGNIHKELGRRAEEPMAAPKPREGAGRHEFFLDGGAVWYGNGEFVEAVSLPPADQERLAAMVSLRDEIRDLLEFERTSDDDAAVAAAVGRLDASYEAFAEKYGRVGDAKNARLWNRCGRDYSLSVLRSVEEHDASGAFVGKADILSKRVQAPVPPVPERLDSARDALALSIDRLGRVDMAFIASLTGLDEAAAAAELGDAVVRDPASGDVVLAEEYLSGDVASKLETVEAALSAEEAGPGLAAKAQWAAASGVEAASERAFSKADPEMRDLLDGRNGSWTAYADPVGAKVAADAESTFQSAFRRLPRHNTVPYALALAADLRPGCRLVDAEGEPTGLWESLVARSISWSHESYNVPPATALLRYLAQLPGDTVSDEAFAALLLHSGSLERALGGALAPMLGIEPVRPWADDGREKALAAARMLREDPDVLDVLLVKAEEWAEKESGWPKRPLSAYANRESLAEFKKAREAFEEEHPVPAPDAERVAELSELKERLEEVLPAPLDADEIAANLGSPWIPPSVYYEFAAETFKFDEAERLAGSRSNASSKWIVSRSDESGSWQVKYSGAPKLTPAVEAEYGTEAMPALALMESAMNGSTIVVTKPDPNAPADKPDARIKDPAATAAAYRQRDRINAAFKEWVFADPARAEMLAGIYNRRFNNIRPRHFDGSYLTLPGSNTEISLRPHQLDAVARVLQSGEGSLVAHVVGAGKTFACVASVMESRRVGKAGKPLVVVPNHLTEQWASDIVRLYPSAKVLYMNAADTRTQDATRAFWARAATGDWDAVVVGHSRFDMLHLSDERRIAAAERRVDEISASIRAANKKGNAFSVKKLEAMRKRAQSLIDSLRKKEGSTEGVSFEDVGFDMVVVDEAHYYKNLAIAGRSVAGMSSSASAKCENLIDICDYLRDTGRGSNIVFATGTPVSNTMSELYNMQRYLAPDLLRSQGVYYFSDWAQNYGETVQSVEMKPESNGFQVKERFAKFHNLPELMASFHSFADIVTQDDLDLDVPEVEKEVVAVEADEEQKALVEKLSARADDIRDGLVDPSADNMLKITSEGRALALSPKILSDGGPDGREYGSEGGKLRKCAENVAAVWRDTAEDKGTQLVFCDASTPNGKSWNVYEEIRAQLVGMGIPESEIAFVHDYPDPKKRDVLFEKVNAGEVRVLFGSTQKLGTGTNVQKRLAAIHDVDCPWRPADLEQRLGRIQRQGNMHKKVKDFRYVTSGTFDSYLYQTVERKQRFISQVFTNKSPLREGADIDEAVMDYATIKAVASGDPAVKERLEKENRLQELGLQRQAYDKRREAMKDEVENRLRPTLEALERKTAALAEDEAAFKKASADLRARRDAGMPFSISVGGRTFASNQEAAAAIVKFRSGCHNEGDYPIGEAYGLALSLHIDRHLNAYLAVHGAHEVYEHKKPLATATNGPETCLRQIEREIAAVAEGLPDATQRLEATRTRLEQTEEQLAAPWEFEDEQREIEAWLASHSAIEDGREEPRKDGGRGNAAREPWEKAAARFKADPAELERWHEEKIAEMKDVAIVDDPPFWGVAFCVPCAEGFVSPDDAAAILPSKEELELFVAMAHCDLSPTEGGIPFRDIVDGCEKPSDIRGFDAAEAKGRRAYMAFIRPSDFDRTELEALAAERPDLFDEESCAKWPELADAKKAAALEATFAAAGPSSKAVNAERLEALGDDEKDAPGHGGHDEI